MYTYLCIRVYQCMCNLKDVYMIPIVYMFESRKMQEKHKVLIIF